MSRITSIIAGAVLLSVALIGVALLWGPPAAGQAENEIVAALPYQLETKYEEDPFRQDRIDKSTQHLQAILLVYGDGRTKVVHVK